MEFVGRLRRWCAPLVMALAAAGGARADGAQSQVSPITVIATTPLPGAGIDLAKAPYDVRSLTAADLAAHGGVKIGF